MAVRQPARQPPRQPWEALPATVRSAIERETGPVLSTEAPKYGRSAEFAATLHTDRGAHFCKGVRLDRPYAWTHRNEAAVAHDLPIRVAPMLTWEIEEDGWLVLVFEHVPGVPPDLAPGSPHLERVRDLVSTIGEYLTPCPDAAKYTLAERWANAPGWAELRDRQPDDLDPWARDHLTALAELEGRAALDGDTLAHIDLHAGNVIMSDRRTVAVDWAWSVRGPAWFDPASLVVRLVDEGHRPQDAESWAQGIPAFAAAPDNDLTAFAIRLAGIWEGVARSPEAREHARGLADAAREWARYRVT